MPKPVSFNRIKKFNSVLSPLKIQAFLEELEDNIKPQHLSFARGELLRHLTGFELLPAAPELGCRGEAQTGTIWGILAAAPFLSTRASSLTSMCHPRRYSQGCWGQQSPCPGCPRCCPRVPPAVPRLCHPACRTAVPKRAPHGQAGLGNATEPMGFNSRVMKPS